MSDFEIVAHKRRRLKRTQGAARRRLSAKDDSQGFPELSVEFEERRISDAKQSIADSHWYSGLFCSIYSSLLELGTTDVQEIICYGLGHFSDTFASRFQLGLLITLKEHFLSDVLIYDPIFYPKEKEYLLSKGFTVIEQNEEGKRSISKISIIYLPHCPKQLMNNFIFSNWGLNLNKCLILGNSFSSIITSNPDNELKKTLNYIYNIYSTVKEITIENKFSHDSVFNDLSLHLFPLEKLLKHNYTFWNNSEAPNYNEDIEFIRGIPEEYL